MLPVPCPAAASNRAWPQQVLPNNSSLPHPLSQVLTALASKPLVAYLTWSDTIHIKQAAHLTLDLDLSALASLYKVAHLACALSHNASMDPMRTRAILMLERWITAIDGLANFADTPTQKAITTWVLMARWILRGLQEHVASYREICKFYSQKASPSWLLCNIPHLLAPVRLSHGASSRLSFHDLDSYLKTREPLQFIWQIFPALQHYDQRFTISVRTARHHAEQSWHRVYEHYQHGQRLLTTMQNSPAQRTQQGAPHLLDQTLIPMATQMVNHLQRATFRFQDV